MSNKTADKTGKTGKKTADTSDDCLLRTGSTLTVAHRSNGRIGLIDKPIE